MNNGVYITSGTIDTDIGDVIVAYLDDLAMKPLQSQEQMPLAQT